jgi:hypothetical protein
MVEGEAPDYAQRFVAAKTLGQARLDTEGAP